MVHQNKTPHGLNESQISEQIQQNISGCGIEFESQSEKPTAPNTK